MRLIATAQGGWRMGEGAGAHKRATAHPPYFCRGRGCAATEESDGTRIDRARKRPRGGPVSAPAYRVGAVRRWLRRLAELFLLAEGESAGRKAREDMYRANGACVCAACGDLYFDHARDPFEPCLNVLCSGERVKL